MKRLIALAVLTLTSQAIVTFAGEPVVSSKQVIAPPPPPPPEFFRPNEFDIGAFGTYATGVGSSSNSGRLHAWGGGIDLTYWFPWKYAGVRFQGTGASIRTNNGSQTKEVTLVQGFAPVSVTAGGGSVAAGVLTGDFMLRLPLDDFWPGVHLAPYFFGGFGGILLGSGGEGRSVSETFTVTNDAGVSREVTSPGVALMQFVTTSVLIACSGTGAADWNIASLRTSGSSAKRVTTLSMALRTTLYRQILASDMPFKQKQ